ncbi:MAG TPA: excinuclease ABC subunit UvrB [Bacillota bacterium]|nr:excinuclease ABC subunit UvrB [Bacillota bacterium]
MSATFQPAGDQPRAVREIAESFTRDDHGVVLLGVTGSGKTATMAWTIEQLQRPTLVIAHNKTLAAQLAGEFKEFFPDNAVEYFVSFYDYYQPEAYIAATDTYIEKDTLRNEEIEKLRHSATTALFERRDVIVVASVSCIYGLGSPEDYRDLVLSLRVGQERRREEILRKLVEIQYKRNDMSLERGHFRVAGDVVEVYPAASTDRAIRVQMDGDCIERMSEIDTLTGEVLGTRDHVAIYPATHYVTAREKMERAVVTIEAELEERLAELRSKEMLLEAQRLEQRTRYDLEMMREVGVCSGIENYSRHLTGRAPGQPPYTLLDFFPKDFFCIIDESHQSIPQIGAMYEGDRSRKLELVRYGFRLPSALDNRPLTFAEFEERVGQTLYVSATPADYEKRHSQRIAEQIVRPTGLLDPEVIVRPIRGQIDDLIGEVRARVAKGQRVLVTTLTKKMAEQLTDYMRELGIKVRYLHSEVETLERMVIVRDLRLGVFDVLVGINLLREGLDLPEVSLVAILDADKEGYLRSERSLIQTMGRAARNAEGRVILYADRITGSMQAAMSETTRRREIQHAYNLEHGITPTSIIKPVRNVLEATHAAADVGEVDAADERHKKMSPRELAATIDRVRKEMREAARMLEFERAAELRDLIVELEARRSDAPPRASRPRARAR